MQINAIEISNNEEWHNLWLETHYKQVQLAFKRNHWFNCLLILGSMNFIMPHIYKEDNTCGDKLECIDLTLNSFTWWNASHLSFLLIYVVTN